MGGRSEGHTFFVRRYSLEEFLVHLVRPHVGERHRSAHPAGNVPGHMPFGSSAGLRPRGRGGSRPVGEHTYVRKTQFGNPMVCKDLGCAQESL